MIFRTSRPAFKKTAITLCCVMLWEIISPVSIYALTGGPSQPEVQSFEPIGTTDMVDPFSGDFNYNIPLMDVEGYPINISYHSGITADQEASWTGLGWNINPGAITRNMRGLPDDFNGDTIKKHYRLKPDKTTGATLGGKFELIGADKLLGASLGLNFGVFHNSYRGIGYEFGASPSLNLGDKTKGSLNANIGYNSQAGYNVSTTLGLRTSMENSKDKTEMSAGASVSASYNSRGGLKSLSFGTNTAVQQVGNFKKESDWSTTMLSNDRGTSLSFGSPTYIPSISMPMKNTGVVLSGSLGFEWWLLHPGVSLTGYYTETKLAADSVKRLGYGYLNLQNAKSDTSLTDFNREKDGGYNKEMAQLPVPQLTYDMFNVAGHGVGGTYRAFRNDVGVIGDDKMTNLSTNTNISLEAGIGNVLHGGADFRRTHNNTKGGKWNELGAVNFTSPSTTMNNQGYEVAYFKNPAEMVKTTGALNEKMSTKSPFKLNIYSGGSDVYTTGTLTDAGGNAIKVSPNNNQNGNTIRQPRNSPMSYITGKEKYAALDTAIRYFNINQNPDANGELQAPMQNRINRNGGKRRPHHITELTVHNTEGGRYVYGIPAYNNIQREITFGVADTATKNCVSGHVYYPKFNGNILALGSSNLYNETVTPAYAHSYLLTGVLSDDFVDVTGDGITNDDFGTGVKFNYSMVNAGYKWRVPFMKDSASYNSGYFSDIFDDKASIVYGEKEIWHLHSIETKNYVALFKISPREDGLGTLNLHGGKDINAKMYKLDSIVLYAKFNGKINTTPIKIVKFIYDYSLCQGIDNANGNNGKLTLKEIIFLNGASKKGYRNKYKFTYQNNYKYSLKSYDRWGNYLKYGLSSGCAKDSVFPSEAPYTPQSRNIADNYASAWTLNQIQLPSGGTIKVTYEADDYAFVQDKKASQMFKIAGFGQTTTFSNSQELYGTDGKPNNYIFFKLQNPSADLQTEMQSLHHYMKNLSWLYFNAFVELMGGKYDYIRGYLKPTNVYGIAAGNSNYGYIKINTVSIGDKEGSGRQIHPISKVALQFMRIEVPHLVFPGSAPSEGTESNIKGSIGALEEAKIMMFGFNTHCLDKGAAKSVILNKSYLRLHSPYGHKLGGGSRVKKLEFFDNWSQMSGRSGTSKVTQGLEYDYNLPEEIESNPDGTNISSGVASWEPEIGGDENPYREPVFYTLKTKMGVDNEFFQEKPYGESQMPAPVVGYRYIKVKQIAPDNVGVRGTGYDIFEFYTAKDFPAKIYDTEMDKLNNVGSGGNMIREFLGIDVNEYVGVSQGYSIELNDMHGKPKSKTAFKVNSEHKAELISGVLYEYVTEPGKRDELSNVVDVISPSGKKFRQQMGVNADMTIDMREQVTENNSFSLGVGLDNTVVGPFPLIIPHAWPMPVNEISSFKSSVVVKVLRRNAILKRTTAIKEGSYINTNNIVWDSETGETLITSTTNEFGDILYSITYPAHWYSSGKGMKQAYNNLGARVSDTIMFMPGDEVWLTDLNGSNTQRVWVNESKILKDKDNNTVSLASKKALIYRSGYRNKATTPIFQFSAKELPYQTISNEVYLRPQVNTPIIDAGGTLFSDQWNGLNMKQVGSIYDEPTDTARELKDLFVWLLERDSLCLDHNTTMIIYNSSNPSIGPSWYYNSNLYKKTQGGSPTTGVVHYIIWKKSNPYSYSLQFYTNYNNTGLNLAIEGFGSSFTCSDVTRIEGIKGHVNGVHNASLFAYKGDELKCLTVTVDGDNLSRYKNQNLYYSATGNNYYLGKRGNFRKSKEFQSQLLRSHSIPVSPRHDGTYVEFNPLYKFSNNVLNLDTTGWRSKNTVTHYAHNGQELENKDAIGNYSSALFAFNKSLPIAVAQNSRYLQQGFFSCDADNDNILPDVEISYWKFLKANKTLPTFNSKVSHTGIKSIELSAADSVQSIVKTYQSNSYVTIDNLSPFANDAFYPTRGKYFISAWVKVDTTAKAANFSRPYIKVFSFDNSQTQLLYPSGPIVEGWQQISGEVTFDICPSPYYVRLMADPLFKTYFDDIRVHPADALMKGFVYDPVTLRLMSTLDENNYATFYEYDEEGNLIHTKRETERGVMTIMESRKSIQKTGN